MGPSVGRTGALIVVLIFGLLAAEDAFIWMNSGTVLGIEFFVAGVLALFLIGAGMWEARQHPPSRR